MLLLSLRLRLPFSSNLHLITHPNPYERIKITQSSLIINQAFISSVEERSVEESSEDLGDDFRRGGHAGDGEDVAVVD